MALLAIIALVSFIVFLFILVKAIVKKSRKAIIFSTAALLVTFFLALKIDLKNVGDLFSKEIDRLKPRSNNEIYALVFKLPADSCVNLINTVDQVIPVRDCCVWLEFTTCPEALGKIIRKLPYTVSGYAAGDSATYNPVSKPMPLWWMPAKLGDSLIKLHHSYNSATERTLLISRDSTHVYCCDRAE